MSGNPEPRHSPNPKDRIVTDGIAMMTPNHSDMATDAGHRRPSNPEALLRSQKQIWNLEQAIVAALVQLDPDPPVETSVIADNPLFHLVRDNHRDVYSFSSAPELFGGVDISFSTEDENVVNQTAVAVYVVVDRRTMQVVHHDHEFFVLDIPYIPTYLAFREIEPLEILIDRQVHQRPELTPQAILVDGNGILHPRNAGIACFLGTRTDIPTIGVGKSLLYEGGWTRETVDQTIDHFLEAIHTAIGCNPQSLAAPLTRYRGLIMKKTLEGPTSKSTAPPPAGHDGATSNQDDHVSNRRRMLKDLAACCNGIAIPLKRDSVTDTRFPVLGCTLVGHGGQIAVASEGHPVAGTCKPIFVSVGHKISLQNAVQITASLSLARVPEPIRQADLIGRDLIRSRGNRTS